MAEETIVTNIVANANFSNLISDLNRVSASLANLQTQVSATNKSLAAQIAVVNRQFGDTLRSTGQFTTHFATVGSDVEKFGKSLDKGQLKLRDYYNTWQQHSKTAGGLIRDLAQQQVRLQNAIMQPLGRNAEGMMQFAVHVPRGLDLIKNKTALTHQELMIMNRVMQEGAGQLINWGKNTQWAGRQLTVGLTIPLAAFGKAAADAFKVADQELTRLTKVYGDIAGASAKDLGRIREEVSATAKELAGSLGASFSETLALGADIAATGKTGQELLGSIRETTRLAVLGEVDRQEAMKATLAIQSAFNQNTTELANSINFLNAVENQTSTTLNDLVEAIPKAGPVIKGLGGSVQDLALYLTAMREGGISASEGANALKSALASLINPTDVAVKKFQGFGIDLMGIVSNNAGNVTNTLLALQAALDKLDPLQKQQAIEQLFGKFQFSRLNALFDNLGRQGSQTLQVLDLMKASTQDLANIAGRELTQVTESASGKYKRALEELRANLASVGDQFLTINTQLIKFVNKVIDFASNLPGPIKSILSLLGGITAISGPLIMLTGVLGNFLGYIVKGVYHFKSFFKGAEGWRLLTPEILAATKAGSMAETTFYNDAKAATILNQALRDLSIQYDGLAMRAQSGAISAQPLITTLGGNIVVPGGGGRVVDPNHPLAGTFGTRSSAHMVPRGTEQPGTIFGLVPSSTPVNLAIRDNPQIYMGEALPPVPGLTTIQTKKYGQVSTGIVAAEAARHHAMTATLAMQSTEEVIALKKMMADTGTVTKEFMQTFDDLVPITSQITNNAALQSAAIVSELRAGTITVAQAREKIIALNIEVERMLGAATTEYAAATGRTINLTNVPTLEQPVVGPTGKSNMRELFKQRTGGFFSSIARALGVRTSGAGYNIETTRPRKYNMGGNVYFNNGDQVPGPNVNADVVPAMLTPGEFVIRRGVAQQDPEGMRMLNAGQAVVVPIQGRNLGGRILKLLPGMVKKLPRGFKPEGISSIFARAFFDTKTGSNVARQRAWLNDSMTIFGRLYPKPDRSGFYNPSDIAKMSNKEITSLWKGIEKGHFAQKRDIEGTDQYFVPGIMGPQSSSINKKAISGGNAGFFADDLENVPIHPMVIMRAAAESLGYSGNPAQFMKAYTSLITALRGKAKSRTNPNFDKDNTFEMFAEKILRKHLNKVSGKKNGNFFDELFSYGTVRGVQEGRTLTKLGEKKSGKGSLYTARIENFNRGGMVPGYAMGGSIARSSYLYRRAMAEGSLRDNVLPKSYLLKALGAKFGTREGGNGYSITSLPINPNLRMFEGMGLSPAGQKALYGSLVDTVSWWKPRTLDKNVKRGFGKNDVDGIWHSTLGFIKNISNLPASDQKIINGFYEKASRMQMPMPQSVVKQLFGKRQLNKGGMVPGYNRGGMIRKYQEGGDVAPRRRMGMGSGLASNIIGSIGGQMLGSKLGGTTGGFIGMFAGPMILNQITKIISGLFGAARAGQGFLGVLKALSLVLRANPIGLAVTAALLAATAFYKMYDNAKKARQASADALVANEEQSKELGINYQNLSDKIKNATQAAKEQRQLLLAKAASSAQVGGGLMMTVKELREMKKQALETKSSIVEMFNKMKDDDVIRAAADLKAQLVAAGKSATEAAKEIFAIISVSNKSGQAISAISSTAFMSIVDKATAAAASIKTFSDAMNIEDIAPEELAASFEAGTNAIDAYNNSLVGTKDSTGKVITSTEALNMTIDKMNNSSAATTEIGNDNYDVLVKQNPELKGILNKSDTILSSWVKIKLYTLGVQDDLQNMSETDAQNLLLSIDAINAAAKDMVTNVDLAGNSLDALAELAAKWKTESDSAKKAAEQLAKKIKTNADEEIKIIDKRIAKINEEADARKKALQDQQDAENYNLELQKEQLNLQNLMASGNLEAAAQSQLRIRQLTSENQTKQAIAAIDKQAAEETKKLEKEKAKLLKEVAEGQKALAKAQEAATKSAEKYSKIQVLQTSISATLSRASYTDKSSAEFKALAEALASDVKALAGLGPEGTAAAARFTPNVPNSPSYTNGILTEGKPDWVNQLSKLVDQNLGYAQEYFADFGGSVRDFGFYVNKLVSTQTPGPMGLASKSNIASELSAYGGKYQNQAGGKLTEEQFYSLPNAPRIPTDKAIVIPKSEFPKLFGADLGKTQAEAIRNAKALMGNKTSVTSLSTNLTYMADGTVYSKDNERVGVWYNSNVGGTKFIPYFAMGGSVEHYGPGGNVRGPGTGTSDSIPAYLSNGEYVIRASSVDKYGKEFFDGLNAQKFGMGGMPNPFSMGMQWFGNTLKNAVSSVSKIGMGFDPTKSFGSQDNWSKFAMATMFLPGGEGKTIAAKGLVSSTKASTTIIRNLRKAIIESAISSGRSVPSISAKDSLKLSTSMLDDTSDTGAAFRKYWGKAYDILVASKNPVVDGMSKDDFFKSIVGNAEDATTRWKGTSFDFSGPSASEIDKPSDFIKAANAAYLQAHGLSSSQPLAMFRAVRAPSDYYENYIKGMQMSDPSLTPEQITSINIAHELGGYWSLNSRMGASYLRNLGLTRSYLTGKPYGGLYRADIPAESFPTPIGMGGMMEEYANVFNPATIDSLRSATRIGLGWDGRGGPQRYLTMSDFYKTSLMPSRGQVPPEAVERLKSVLSDNEIRSLLDIMRESGSGRSIKLSSRLMRLMPGHSKYNLEQGGAVLWLDIIKRAEEALGQPLLVPKLAGGGYINPSYNPNMTVPAFADGGQAKKQNWFQRYVSKLTATQDQMPAWARDPFGMGQLLRKFAGQGRKGDNPALAAALLPLNFAGTGIIKSGAKPAFAASSELEKLLATKIKPHHPKDLYSMEDTLSLPAYASTKSLKEFLSSRMFHGGNLSQGFLPKIPQRHSTWLGGSFYATDDASLASVYAAQAQALGKVGNLYEIFQNLKPEELLDLRHNAPSIFTQNPQAYEALVDATVNWTKNPNNPLFPRTAASELQDFLRALKLEGSEGKVLSENLSRIASMMWMNLGKPLQEVGIKGVVNRGGWFGANRRYPFTVGGRSAHVDPTKDVGFDILSMFNTEGLSFNKISDLSTRPFSLRKYAEGGYINPSYNPNMSVPAFAGGGEVLSKVFNRLFGGAKALYEIGKMVHRTRVPITPKPGAGSGKLGQGMYFATGSTNKYNNWGGPNSFAYKPNLSFMEKMKVLFSKGFYSPTLKDTFNKNIAQIALDKGYIGVKGGTFGVERTLPKMGEKGWGIKQIPGTGRLPMGIGMMPLGVFGGGPLDIQMRANGGYIRKFHDWNGQVPGPYGKEVGAVLKAGTEGVYQQSYIKSLQNDTMGNVTYNMPITVNAAEGMDTMQLAQMTTNMVVEKLNKINNQKTSMNGPNVVINSAKR